MCHDPPGNRIEPGATLLTRMFSGASCCASDFAEADLGRLHRVVGHPAAGFASPDRRNHDDRAAAAAFMCGTARREARIAGNNVSSSAACHSASVVSSRSVPAGATDVVDEDVEAAEFLDRLLDHER